MAHFVVATAYGGPEVLELVEGDIAPPGPGEALVEVRAAGVNPIDYKAYSGAMGDDPARLPMRLGAEAAGVVRAVGAGAVGPAGPITVGDEVIAYRISGGYASEVVAPVESILPRPSSLGWEAAAGLMLTGATAVHALTAVALGEGEVVVIHGASGGVGLMAVQLAVAKGARVIATAGAASHEHLIRLGATPVAYGEGLVDRVRHLAPEGVNAAVDTAGSDEAVDASLALVADRTRIATIAAFGRGFAAGIRVLGGSPPADPGTDVRAAARLELLRLVDAQRLEVAVDRTFALADAAEAHRYVARGHTHGKVVLLPSA